MAPELRKRKPAVEAQKPNGATKADKVVKPKRKAPVDASPEDASPVSLKKQKSVKKTTVVTKVADKPATKAKGKKSKPVEEVKVIEEETTIDIPDESSESEDEGKEVHALAEEVDSGDEDITEGDELFKTGQDVGKVPEVSSEVQKASQAPRGETGVIYIGRIPHGFYEHEMRQYFEQFGTIVQLRLSRNKKTGASKHFAFIKFAEANTAEIVAKTMDNYLLFGHILKCRVIPNDQVHQDLFKGANRRFKGVPWNKMAGLQLQKPQTEGAWEAKVVKEESKRAKKAAKLKEIGYEFEAPVIRSVPAPAPVAAIEEPTEEVKAIEETEKVEEPVEAVEEAEPVAEEPEPESKPAVQAKAKTTKAKATRGGKARKAKA